MIRSFRLVLPLLGLFGFDNCQQFCHHQRSPNRGFVGGPLQLPQPEAPVAMVVSPAIMTAESRICAKRWLSWAISRAISALPYMTPI